MAAASNAAILADLVADISRLPSQSRELKKARDYALKTVKSNQYARANQFEVDASLRGLVEKFRVVGRDDLGGALEANWKRFAAIPNRFAPDILDLLLHLSHDPVRSLPFAPIEREAAAETANLTWSQILRDDPYSDEELWETEHYSDASSGHESGEDSEVKTPLSERRQLADPTSPTQSHLIFVDDYQKYEKRAQFWKQTPQNSPLTGTPVALTELDAIRESIHMLRGLPTSLYELEASGIIQAVPGYAVQLVSVVMLDSVIADFAAFGTALRILRAWAAVHQHKPIDQAIRSTLQAQVKDFESRLNTIEMRFTNNESDIPTSLISVLDSIAVEVEPLLRFDHMMQTLDYSNSGISSLSALYSRTIREQLANNDSYHKLLSKIFLAAFRVYLRPVAIWMTTGELADDSDWFFIIERDGKNEDASIWHNQVAPKKSSAEIQVVPVFMAHQVNKILNAGKSVRFLKRLGYDIRLFDFSDAPKFTIEEICDYPTELDLFDTRFLEALDKWINAKYNPSSSLLRNILVNNLELFRHLNALRTLFFLSDGDATQSIFYPMFNALERRDNLWNDQYLLQERLKHAYADSQCVESTSVSVRSSALKTVFQSSKALNSINIDYQLPWPLLNVIRKSSTASYQKICKLLLQISRAKYLLRETTFLREASNGRNTKRPDPVSVALRQELQFFVDMLHTHVVHSVLEPSYDAMIEQMKRSTDLDDMTEVHDTYISSILAQCLLMRNLNPIHNAIIAILDLVIVFAETRRKQTGQPLRNTKPPARRARNKQGRRRALSTHAATLAKQRLPAIDDESSSDDQHEGANAEYSNANDSYDADTEALAESKTEDKLANMHLSYEHLHGFVVAGLRGIARSGGEPSWEMLAEQLDWKSGRDTD